MIDLFAPENNQLIKKLMELTDRLCKPNTWETEPVKKISTGLYSYWIGCTKSYVFEPSDIANFYIWHYQNNIAQFIEDVKFFSSYDMYFYFKRKNAGFENKYPNKFLFVKTLRLKDFGEIVIEQINDQGIETFVREFMLADKTHVSKMNVCFINNSVCIKYAKTPDNKLIFR